MDMLQKVYDQLTHKHQLSADVENSKLVNIRVAVQLDFVASRVAVEWATNLLPSPVS